MVLDLRDITQPWDEWLSYRPFGPVHHFCHRHDRQSRVIRPYTEKRWHKDLLDALVLDGYSPAAMWEMGEFYGS